MARLFLSRNQLRQVETPGQVPRHWWHDVQTLSPTALSVNHWVAGPADTRERVKEGLVRLLWCGAGRGRGVCSLAL
jgi:hypothetical protein